MLFGSRLQFYIFFQWQTRENAESDSDPLHWDHAVILTGLDVHVVDRNKKISAQVTSFYCYAVKLLPKVPPVLYPSLSSPGCWPGSSVWDVQGVVILHG